MTKRKHKYPCNGCGGDWLENPAPMFHDHIWEAIVGAEKELFLCLPCTVRRMLTPCKFNARWLKERTK